MITPACPLHGDMQLVEISQGDTLLCFVWFCREKECDECADYDPLVHGQRSPKYSKAAPAESIPPVAVTPDPVAPAKIKTIQLSFLDQGK
jgi:hypothetical protein